MAWPEPIDARLPAPPDGEPPDLRADILDEIADHLACAMERERRRTRDEAEARGAVLARFGDPARLARRLWLDAMKETIMQQRTQLLTNVVLVLGCVAICIFAWTMMRQNERSTAALLATLESIGAPDAGASMDWTEANVTVTLPDGVASPAAIRLALKGRAFDAADERLSTIEQTSDADGHAHFGPVRPGSYVLLATDSEDRTLTRSVVLYPGRENTVDLAWRRFDDQHAKVAIDIDIPDDVREHVAFFEVLFEPLAHDDGEPDRAWSMPPLNVLVRPDGSVGRVAQSDPAKQEYRHVGSSNALLARIDVDLIDFDATIDVRPDLVYAVTDIRIYTEAGESGLGRSGEFEPGELRVLRANGTRRDRQPRSRYDFVAPPPFHVSSADRTTWTVVVPPHLADWARPNVR